MAKFGEWCDLNNEEPLDGQYVIAKTSHGSVEGGCIYREGWFMCFGQVISDVISWMPLPE